MKNKINKIMSFLFVIMISILFIDTAKAVKIDTNNTILKVYEVKEKEEVLVENNRIIDFYEETHEEINKLIEEKKQEEIRIAEEKRIEEERINRNKTVSEYAQMFIGNPYVMGGNSLTDGTDCSGFVMLVYSNYGVTLPRTTTGQAASGYEVSEEDIMPGDIISYGYGGYPSHSALYIGNELIVHAATPELGIRTDSMYIMPIITIRRVI